MIKNKKGFTIIEVVLVLAIAGLIFLMVFIALPALQRSQRNSRRRQDMARILSALNDYQSNNNGKMPDSSKFDAFIQKYVTAGAKDSAGKLQTNLSTVCVGDQFCDPDGTPYRLEGGSKLMIKGVGAKVGEKTSYKGSATVSDDSHIIFYWTNSKCSDEEDKLYMTAGATEVSISYKLEGGAVYCGDNQ